MLSFPRAHLQRTPVHRRLSLVYAMVTWSPSSVLGACCLDSSPELLNAPNVSLFLHLFHISVITSYYPHLTTIHFHLSLPSSFDNVVPVFFYRHFTVQSSWRCSIVTFYKSRALIDRFSSLPNWVHQMTLAYFLTVVSHITHDVSLIIVTRSESRKQRK